MADEVKEKEVKKEGYYNGTEKYTIKKDGDYHKKGEVVHLTFEMKGIFTEKGLI